MRCEFMRGSWHCGASSCFLPLQSYLVTYNGKEENPERQSLAIHAAQRDLTGKPHELVSFIQVSLVQNLQVELHLSGFLRSVGLNGKNSFYLSKSKTKVKFHLLYNNKLRNFPWQKEPLLWSVWCTGLIINYSPTNALYLPFSLPCPTHSGYS